MDINLILNIVKYIVFSIFLFSGTLIFYRTITPKDIRENHRLRFMQQLQRSSSEIESKIANESLDDRFAGAGLKFLNTFRYEMIRLTLFIIYCLYYIILPLLLGESLSTATFAMLSLLWLLTEHRFNIPVSLINITLKLLISRKRKKRSIELFILYDVLKADLRALHVTQDVNIYNLLRESVFMFKYIDGTISRFLSLWLTNPTEAEKVFYQDIRTQGAKTLGEIIVKIDSLSRNEALSVIQTESSAYAQHFYKEDFRENQKRKNKLQTLFSINVLLNAGWLIIFIANMLLLQLNNSTQIL